MPDTRAIEGQTGAPALGNPAAMEGMEVPDSSKSSIVAWLHKFSSRNTRRGSIGFSGETSYRYDDDSNDGMPTNIPQPNNGDSSRNETSPFNMKRLRNDSMSDLQTPGGDGDLHFFSTYRRRPSAELQQSDMGAVGFHLKKDGVLSINSDDKMDIERNASFSTLQPIIEGKEIKLPVVERDSVAEAMMEVDPEDGGLQMTKKDPLAALRQEQNLQMSPSEAKAAAAQGNTNENIFLIDLEPVRDADGVKLQPKTKKFSLTSMLNAGWTQNWFFRNENAEEEESSVKEATEVKEKVRRISRSGTPSSDGEDGDEDKVKAKDKQTTFLGKFQQAIAEHPNRLREMNTWQPQSS